MYVTSSRMAITREKLSMDASENVMSGRSGATHGSTSPMTARNSSELETLFDTELKYWSS